MNSNQYWHYFVIGGIVGLVILELERRRIAKGYSICPEEEKPAFERSMIFGRVTITSAILFEIFFIYLFIWIQLLGKASPDHKTIFTVAIGSAGSLLVLLSAYRRRLKKLLSKLEPRQQKRSVEMRLTTNTIYIVGCYVVLFYFGYQYIVHTT